MRNFLYKNVLIFRLYMLAKEESTHCGQSVSIHFGIENQQYSQKCFQLYQLSMNNLLYQTVPIPKPLTN